VLQETKADGSVVLYIHIPGAPANGGNGGNGGGGGRNPPATPEG
jgi:hypothetical protein